MWTARREDICYAPSNRHEALRDVAGAIHAVIVVGSTSSVNTEALERELSAAELLARVEATITARAA